MLQRRKVVTAAKHNYMNNEGGDIYKVVKVRKSAASDWSATYESLSPPLFVYDLPPTCFFFLICVASPEDS